MEVTKDSSSVVDLKYQGREARRANSKQRRRKILEAALRIVVREGVRGVRHRAVAKEAEVPLSATTYYFKDITDLISDAFTLFVEMGVEAFSDFWQDSESQLQAAANSLDNTDEAREAFVNNMTELAVGYVQAQLEHHRDLIIVERCFQIECIRNDNLRPIAYRHQRCFLESLENFFEQMGSAQPAIDARLFASIINQVEYDALVREKPVDFKLARVLLRRQVELMLGSS
ncbi:TetR family transcriptional regulator [Candidatus Sororendozoicomonas aggregata]|uniref:TetR/AcrR family transcriptional regulator n=1 Tax=Candidatus Sororendozoicomonas aggregata TaxID=3073239 RepID=UPI002ED26DD6